MEIHSNYSQKKEVHAKVNERPITSVTKILDITADLKNFFPNYVAATGVLLEKETCGRKYYVFCTENQITICIFSFLNT
jgi:hypothetical protein